MHPCPTPIFLDYIFGKKSNGFGGYLGPFMDTTHNEVFDCVPKSHSVFTSKALQLNIVWGINDVKHIEIAAALLSGCSLYTPVSSTAQIACFADIL